MNVLLITYDLKKPGQGYADFHKVIKSYGAWARLSESSYTVQTDEEPTTVYNKLASHMDKNDQAYVVNLTRPWMGYGPQEVNEWLDQHLPSRQGSVVRAW
jgi:hypothetical protein